MQEDLDRELAYKIEIEELKRNRSNSFETRRNPTYSEHNGFEHPICTITSNSPVTYRRFSADQGRHTHTNDVRTLSVV
jgi:hypothetical protein